MQQGCWRGAKQPAGAGALAVAVAEPPMLAFHSLGPPVLFGVPKPSPTVHPTAPGISLAMLQTAALPAVNAHGSRWCLKVFEGSMASCHVPPGLSRG